MLGALPLAAQPLVSNEPGEAPVPGDAAPASGAASVSGLVSTRGVQVQPPDAGHQAPSVRVGKPETMNLLDDTRPIRVGERLEYMVAEDRQPPIVLFVAEDGSVDPPLAGRVQAAGLTSRQLAHRISQKLEEEYYFQATVHVAEYRDTKTRGQVFVMGQVNNQGLVTIPHSEVMTVSRAILAAGGLTQRADPSRVTVIRRDVDNPEDEKRMEVNVAEIFESGRLDKDLVLQPNDLVFVGTRGDSSGTYTISGAVRGPGVYPIAYGQQLPLSQAILHAGGFSEFARDSAVKLIRFDEDGVRNEEVVNVADVLNRGHRDKDVMLQPGDMIIVPQRWFQF